MLPLVRLRTRPSRDGKTFKYFLDFKDEKGKRRQVSLQHADRRKAKRQLEQKERELRVGAVAPQSMRLSQFLRHSMAKTGDQVRKSTAEEYMAAMEDFIGVIGDIDYQGVTVDHGEVYRQVCLDKGNRPATVSKKLRHLKRVFQLAVHRRQLDENPLRFIDMPRVSKRKVNTFGLDECRRILKATEACQEGQNPLTFLRWDLLIITALSTGMRRGELLNCTWRDIDFERLTVEVSPKEDAAETWEWQIKDADRRTLPLTDELASLLIQHQAGQPEGYPYVFVPVARYDHIQTLRKQGRWKFGDSRLKVVNNFTRKFNEILDRAACKQGEFHDLRRTALTNWLANGMSEHEVMILAGHASFSTTHRFYLAVADDLVDRARKAVGKVLSQDLLRTCCASPVLPTNEKGPATTSDCQPKTYSNGQDWS
jgi:integrase